MFQVLVPVDRNAPPAGIEPGAAILAAGRLDRQTVSVVVAAGQPHVSYADLLKRAASARQMVHDLPADALVQVGMFDPYAGEVRLHPGRAQALAAWIGRPAYRNDLECSDSRSNERGQARREFRKALMTGRPDLAARISARHGIHHW